MEISDAAYGADKVRRRGRGGEFNSGEARVAKTFVSSTKHYCPKLLSNVHSKRCWRLDIISFGSFWVVCITQAE